MVLSRRHSPRTLRDHDIACLERLDEVFFLSTHSSDEEGPKEIYLLWRRITRLREVEINQTSCQISRQGLLSAILFILLGDGDVMKP
jgi:hypothetical protein